MTIHVCDYQADYQVTALVLKSRGNATFCVALCAKHRVVPISGLMWKSDLIGRHLPPSSCPWFGKSINFEMVESLKSINIVMVESLFWNPAFWCCSSCEMVSNVKRLMEVTPRSIFSSCVILFCRQAQDPWRSLDHWRGKTSFLFSLRHCLRGGRTSKTICKNTISASDNQSTH